MAEGWFGLFEVYFKKSYSQRKWLDVFGISLSGVQYVWERYANGVLQKPVHLLWVLSFLKLYPPNTQVLAVIWNVHSATLMKVVKFGLQSLADRLCEVLPHSQPIFFLLIVSD